MSLMLQRYVFWVCFTVLLLISKIPVSLAEHIHDFGTYRIAITHDTSESLGPHAYQIIVEKNEFVLTRLLARSPGALSNTYVVDLDSDGLFEVLVTFSQEEKEKAVVHFYYLSEDHLVSREVPALSVEQSKGYKGNDEFAVKDAKFIRVYQVYEKTENSWVPTNFKRRLALSYDTWKWIEY